MFEPLVMTSITFPWSLCLLLLRLLVNSYGDDVLFAVCTANFWLCVNSDGDEVGVDDVNFERTPDGSDERL